MRILIDIGHPAHVHYFKNFIKIMENKKHKLLVIAREKEVTHKLLKNYNIKFVNRGKGGWTIIGKFFYLIYANFKIFYYSIKFKPQIFLSFASPYVAQVSKLVMKPHIGITDTEHASLGNFAFMPFTDVILTPSCFKKELGKKHFRFDSYTELFYLHEKFFKPNIDVLKKINIKRGENFAIVRFVSWDASHDLLENGLSKDDKISLIDYLSKKMKVFVSSESSLPKQLEKYKLNIEPEYFHDLLSFSSIYVGEGGTTASEAAIMGVPSVYINNLSMGYIDDEINAGLLFQTTNNNEIFKKIDEILNKNDKKYFKELSKKLITNKIEPTSFLVSYVENYFSINR